MEIVKFKDGTYGIRRRYPFTLYSQWKYLSIIGLLWWTSAENVKAYCRFSTREKAKMKFDHLNKLKDDFLSKVEKVDIKDEDFSKGIIK